MAPPPPLRDKVPTLPPEVEQVVLTALTKDPKGRFASVQAFAIALEQASQIKRSSSQPKTALSEPASPPVSAVLAPLVTPVQTPIEMDTPAVQPLPRIAAATAASSDTQARPLPPTSKRPAPEHHPALRSKLTRRRVLIGLVATGVAGGGAMWWIFVPHPLYVYRGHNGEVKAVAWSPDGKRIASGFHDNTAQVWDAVGGGNAFTYKGHNGEVKAVAWSPDGKRIASGSSDKTVQVWDAVGGGNAFTYLGHNGEVNAVAWSPDGKRIASGSSDETVQVWDAVGGGNAFTYLGHNGEVNAVAWSPDGKRIASGSKDGTVQVWVAS
jgi:dipeptidyl aminopeptidase/acylaminoacyl peptidase